MSHSTQTLEATENKEGWVAFRMISSNLWRVSICDEDRSHLMLLWDSGSSDDLDEHVCERLASIAPGIIDYESTRLLYQDLAESSDFAGSSASRTSCKRSMPIQQPQHVVLDFFLLVHTIPSLPDPFYPNLYPIVDPKFWVLISI